MPINRIMWNGANGTGQYSQRVQFTNGEHVNTGKMIREILKEVTVSAEHPDRGWSIVDMCGSVAGQFSTTNNIIGANTGGAWFSSTGSVSITTGATGVTTVSSNRPSKHSAMFIRAYYGVDNALGISANASIFKLYKTFNAGRSATDNTDLIAYASVTTSTTSLSWTVVDGSGATILGSKTNTTQLSSGNDYWAAGNCFYLYGTLNIEGTNNTQFIHHRSVILGVTLANSDYGLLYWKLASVSTTRTLSLYKDAEKTQLVASSVITGDSQFFILTQENASGIYGNIYIGTYTGDSDSTTNTIISSRVVISAPVIDGSTKYVLLDFAYLNSASAMCFKPTIASYWDTETKLASNYTNCSASYTTTGTFSADANTVTKYTSTGYLNISTGFDIYVSSSSRHLCIHVKSSDGTIKGLSYTFAGTPFFVSDYVYTDNYSGFTPISAFVGFSCMGYRLGPCDTPKLTLVNESGGINTDFICDAVDQSTSSIIHTNKYSEYNTGRIIVSVLRFIKSNSVAKTMVVYGRICNIVALSGGAGIPYEDDVSIKFYEETVNGNIIMFPTNLDNGITKNYWIIGQDTVTSSNGGKFAVPK